MSQFDLLYIYIAMLSRFLTTFERLSESTPRLKIKFFAVLAASYNLLHFRCNFFRLKLYERLTKLVAFYTQCCQMLFKSLPQNKNPIEIHKWLNLDQVRKSVEESKLSDGEDRGIHKFTGACNFKLYGATPVKSLTK